MSQFFTHNDNWQYRNVTSCKLAIYRIWKCVSNDIIDIFINTIIAFILLLICNRELGNIFNLQPGTWQTGAFIFCFWHKDKKNSYITFYIVSVLECQFVILLITFETRFINDIGFVWIIKKDLHQTKLNLHIFIWKFHSLLSGAGAKTKIFLKEEVFSAGDKW